MKFPPLTQNCLRATDRLLHRRNEVYETAKDQLFSEDLPPLPRDFRVWLKGTKGLAKATQANYSLKIRQFCSYVRRNLNRDAQLEDAWNIDLCKTFLQSLTPVYAPTTVVNFHSSLSILREFLQLHRRRPSNFQDIRDVFRLLCKTARKRKRGHLQEQKAKRATKPLLGRFYADIYQNETFWQHYNQLIRTTREKERKGEAIVFTQKELSFATALMLSQCSPLECRLFDRQQSTCLMAHQTPRAPKHHS